jgi:hypothetical protein
MYIQLEPVVWVTVIEKSISSLKKINAYLPSLVMKVRDHLYVLGDKYTCHMLIKYNRYFHH